MTHKYRQIAIDGYSSCGKSTIARDLANKLGYLHIDSGAMYRAASLATIRAGIHFEDVSSIVSLMNNTDIDFDMTTKVARVTLNGEVVEDMIRTQEVAQIVSQISIIRKVREQLVAAQRHISASCHVIMDGRDIGTVVFPNADVKLFITADIDVRSRRRWEELLERGMDVSLEEVKHNLLRRDQIDSSREIAPLRKADDAICLDTSHKSRSEQLQIALDIIHDIIPHVEESSNTSY